MATFTCTMDNPSNKKDPLVFKAVMDNNPIELLRQKRWALLKADYIQTSAEHRCIRKFYILSKTQGRELDYEFLPCKLYKNFDPGTSARLYISQASYS